MNSKFKIHFILEGYEENALFELIKELIIMEKIEISFKNCKGGGLIPAYYQNELSLDNYDKIYCVYDVDYKPKDQNGMYSRIRNGLFKVLGSESEVDKISLCTNPNTLLILLLGYDDISNLKNIHSDKKSNTKLIQKYCHKIGNSKEYDASSWQLDLIKNEYIYSKRASFEKMIESMPKLDKNYKSDHVASNILPVIKALISDDVEFFENYMKEDD